MLYKCSRFFIQRFFHIFSEIIDNSEATFLYVLEAMNLTLNLSKKPKTADVFVSCNCWLLTKLTKTLGLV